MAAGIPERSGEGDGEGDGQAHGLGATAGTVSLAAPPSPLGDYRHMKVHAPPGAQPLALAGEIWIELEINEQGCVQNAVVFRSFRHEFDALALDMVKRFRFKPALDDRGQPTDARINWKVVFEPSE